MSTRVYLDNNSTTKLDPLVQEAIVAHIQTHFGNPSSIHSFGQEARSQLNKARQSIAAYLNVRASEIVFTSSATEGINAILRGFFELHPKGHLITSSVEHPAVYNTAQYLASKGWNVTFLQPDSSGRITPDDVAKAIQANTCLIALMAVNNETGVKTDIHKIAELAEQNGIHFFVDGVALLGKELFTIPQGVSAMCFSGHKIHAPKGIGFSFIRKSLKLPSLIVGGHQESGQRGGTENMLGIIALAKAIELLPLVLPQASTRMEQLRDRLEIGLINQFPRVIVIGQGSRIANTSNLSFPGIEGESLLMLLDREGIAVSHGSACSSGALEPSRILLQMGLSKNIASTAIRFSLSRFTTEAEIDRTIEVLARLTRKKITG